MPRRIRGEGSLYKRTDGVWVGVVDLGKHDGRRLRKTVSAKTKRECQVKFLALKKDVDRGAGLTKDITVEEWLNHWLEFIASERVREYTLQGYESKVRNWMIPYLGKYRLDKLNRDHIRGMLRAMKEQGKVDSTRRQVLAILQRAMEVAEQEDRITKNPVRKMDKPSGQVVNRQPLSFDQAKSVLSQLDGNPLAARWAAALILGMRQGECLALKWADVDFVNERLSIRKGQVRIKNKGLITTPPKTSNSIRDLPLIEPVLSALKNTENRGEFVFYGVPCDSKKDWKNWKQLLIDTGICDADMAKGDMPELAAARTTTGTLLRNMGVADTIIRDILGHADVRITQKYYQRTDEPTKRAGLKGLGLSLEMKKSDEDS
jgi:integrase